ncbi:MAG: hypothetical protein AAF813_10275 [Pseudomonadota bacterium]
MSAAKLIEDQLKAIRAVDKRFTTTLTSKTYEGVLTRATETQAARLKDRITRLEKQKVAATKRFDAAIAVEKEALEAVLKAAPNLSPQIEPKPPTKKPVTRRKAAPKKG